MDLRRAYATLGVQPQASPRELRSRFKNLVKQWHPDRFEWDPVGRAEAASRMREINEAYQQVRSARRSGAGRWAPGSSRLSRHDLDRLVRSIGTEGPVDWFFDFVGWTWPLYLVFIVPSSAGASTLLLIPLLVGLAMLLRRQGRKRRRRGSAGL